MLDALKQNLEGKSLAVAGELASGGGWHLRIQESDGKPTIGTCDYCPDRINVAVADGVVTKVLSVG